MILRFTVPGHPQGKGRARSARRGAFVRAFTPEKTVAYEGLIAMAAAEVMQEAGSMPLYGPVELAFTATFHIPASWSKKRREAACWHTGKPDGDNIAKAIGDALNGIAFADDSQVARCTFTKIYGPVPGLHVTVTSLVE